MSFCDLHTHSTFSDGTCTPRELIGLAEAAELRAVALCDHNTVAGLPEFLAAGEGSTVEAVPGVEFSAEYQGTELHILALFIQPRHYKPVTALLDGMLQRKEQSNVELVEALGKAGICLDYGKIKVSTPKGQVNRALIAAEMVARGYAGSVKEAFSQWLCPDRGYYRPPQRLDAFETVRFISSLGAVSVLAHPFLNLDEAKLRIFLPEAKACGLDAMETLYPKYDEATTYMACTIADENGLLHSGGSDFHGTNKPDIQIGTGRGDLRIDTELLEKLRSKAE